MMAGAHVGVVTRHVCELCGEGGMEEGELRTHVLLVHVEGLVHHPQVPTHRIPVLLCCVLGPGYFVKSNVSFS